MADAYPEHLLTRAAAPPYRGEGRFALWHVSEEAGLGRFAPRPSTSELAPLVWAIDTRHLPTFWFPRDCPRGCIWPGPGTSAEDRERFFGQSATDRVHVIEGDWLARMRDCRLFAYRFAPESFRPHEVGGYWVSETTVEALECRPLGDLLLRHVDAGIELRVVASLWPFWRRVVASSVEFSGSRLHTSAHRPEHLDQPLTEGSGRRSD